MRLSLLAIMFSFITLVVNGQEFEPKIETNAFPWNPHTVIVPESPLELQVIFVGGVDMVQTTDTYGNPAGEQPAKQWHDFIGFTPTESGDSDLGWVSINHEMILADDKIGDGGGMTTFKVRRKSDGSLEVVNQTLEDGRNGKFFNVDFANTVGETGMNCGGITSNYDGRIWTAEEWFRSSNSSIYGDGGGVRDTSDFTIGESTPAGFPGYNGNTMKAFENFNYMVEIDPRQAKAIRKQYNWGRQPFEGGCVLPDNQTVYLGADNTPGLFTKFVADTPGDFTKGKTYVFKQNENSYAGSWIEIDMEDFSNVLNFESVSFSQGATGFNRIEWVAYNETDGKVYFTETGRDNPGGRLNNGIEAGGNIAYHHYMRAMEQGVDVISDVYNDRYGRVMVYDPATTEVRPLLEGGPDFPDINPYDYNGDYVSYPEKHLSNPDGLNVMYIKDKTFLVIQEDLNGTSHGRVPPTVNNRTCELFFLDMEKEPTIDNLVRVAIVPIGAEVTGACPTPDGKSLLVNSQHPAGYNEYPFNNSLTFAINGLDKLVETTSVEDVEIGGMNGFKVYPNPTSRYVNFDKPMNVAIYDVNGNRIEVARNTDYIDIREYATGTYFLKNDEDKVTKLIIE